MRVFAAVTFLLSLAVFPAHGLRQGIPKVTGFTEHFSLTIDSAKSDALPMLGAIAEECWAKQKKFFDFAPDTRIKMVFLDEQDYANGYAYSAQKWVVIHMHSAEHHLRGRTRWLENVIAHEIGHIFTLRKMGEDSRFLGAELNHTWLGRGPSVFSGRATYVHRSVPPWLAEGLAQYAAGVCGYDTLDSRRAMALRMAAASGGLLSLAELKSFAWDARRNELIYAQGYSLVRHLYVTYGSHAVNGYLAQAARSNWRSAFSKAFGKGLADIHADWRKAVETDAHWEARGDGEYLLPEPTGPYALESSPTPLKDGRVLYLSARDNDMGRTDLFLGEVSGASRKLLENATSIRLDPDGGIAYVTAVRHGFLQGEAVSDLWAFDAAGGDLDRLSSGARIFRGCAAGGTVYGLRHDQGRASLVKVAMGTWATVWVPPDTLELIDLAPGRNPGSLTLGTTSGFGSDLLDFDLASQELTPLANSPQEEIDPRWSGDTLYFSADYDGAFDIYALAGEKVDRLTQVDGGAFHPFPAPDGIWISAYGPAGFRLARAPRTVYPPNFTVQLPMPGWPAPALLEFEADSYDHSRLGLLGYNLELGVTRTAGVSSGIDTAQGRPDPIYSEARNAATAGIGLWFKNPNGVMDAKIRLGLSRPLDYDGPMHLDRSGFEVRVRAFLPEFVAALTYSAFDVPGFFIGAREMPYYLGLLDGELGFDLRLADHWMFAARSLLAQEFEYLGEDGDKSGETEPHMGGKATLDWFRMHAGVDGIVKGLSAYVEGSKPPQTAGYVPDFGIDAGAAAYGSIARAFFVSASVDHSLGISPTISRLDGAAEAYGVVPIRLQLGTRGGAGLYLDQIRPAIRYRTDAVLSGDEGDAGSWRRDARGLLGQAYGAHRSGTAYLAGPDPDANHEVGFGFMVKAVSFFATNQLWSAFATFDARDFGRGPAWQVMISL